MKNIYIAVFDLFGDYKIGPGFPDREYCAEWCRKAEAEWKSQDSSRERYHDVWYVAEVGVKPHLESRCPQCEGSGEMDSGGTHPWGQGIMIGCPCACHPQRKQSLEK